MYKRLKLIKGSEKINILVKFLKLSAFIRDGLGYKFGPGNLYVYLPLFEKLYITGKFSCTNVFITN